MPEQTNEPIATPTPTMARARSLTKGDILGAHAPRVRQIEIPEWGGAAYMRILPGPAVNELANEQKRLGGENSTRPMEIAAAVVVRGLCDEAGAPLFQTNEAGAVANLDGDVLTRVSRAILTFNGLTEEAAQAIRGN